ncbi:hypothetical protein ACPDHL_08760 [Myroides sp. C15-4]|uniref:hypothetical protein n=1 Tax=unclassified Myroides TaxID=2642485 RepID=UPI001C71AEE7|nr:hypothetical protein [Myroides sp. WP-1]
MIFNERIMWSLILGIFSVFIYAKKINQSEFDKVTNLYKKGQLKQEAYMRKMDSVANVMLDEGVFYEVTEMVEIFKEYEQIAWSKKRYSERRSDYFVILLNNAYLSSKWGASIFYAEKIAQQNSIDGHPRPLVEPAIKVYIYDLLGLEEKVLKEYKTNINSFKEILKKVENNPSKYYWEGVDILRLWIS